MPDVSGFMVTLSERADPMVKTALFAVEHQVATGREVEFDRVIEKMAAAAARYPGFLGVEVIMAPDCASARRVLVNFEDEAALRVWRSSSTAARCRGKADALTLGAPHVSQANGLEKWFVLPNRDEAPPPKWKTAIASALGIYPLIMTVPPLLASLTAGLPAWLSSLFSVILMTPLITWVVMPLVTALLRGWLYPAGRTGGRE